MLSAGMFTSLAAAMMVRRRGFIPGSPPPLRAATVNSLIRRVKILPRLASAAPFLCLIVCHLEWPDIRKLLGKTWKARHFTSGGPGLSRLRREGPTDRPDSRREGPRPPALLFRAVAP